MKRFAYVLSAMTIVGVLCVPVLAQESPSSKVTGVVQNGDKTIVFENNNAGLNLDQINAFGQVKAEDPEIASKVAKNPSLVNDDSFVGKHPALAKYLEKYPNARADIAANPGNYLSPVTGSRWTHRPEGME